MGLWKEVRCPTCGKHGARKFLWMVKCPMRGCPNYDYTLVGEQAINRGSDSAQIQRKRQKVEHRGSFDPGQYAVTIFYENHLGEECEFIADWRTLKRTGKYISACIVPKGTRCAFKASNVANIDELEPHLAKLMVLNKTELRILSRYLARGAESPRIPTILEKIGLA